MSLNGDLLVFYWSPARDWQAVNVSQIAGQKIAGPVASWQTPDGPYNVEHLAGMSPNGDLLVFYWSPRADWQVVNVSEITGETVLGAPTVYQLRDGAETVELLGVRSSAGALLLFWWKPSRDWQVIDLSEISGYPIAADPAAWLTPDGPQIVEHLAAPGRTGELQVFWGFAQPRLLTDAVSRPFQSLRRHRHARRNVLALIWDPRQPGNPAPARAAVEAALFGPRPSVRDYYLENSTGHFTLDSAGVLGPFPAEKPPEYYSTPGPDTVEGWLNRHHRKYAEAIRQASAGFNFAAFDASRDGILTPDELAIVIVVPGATPAGFIRDAVARESPRQELVVDGIRTTAIAEWYTGDLRMRDSLGTIAHELGHLLLGHADMYFSIFQPYAAGGYSLMDQHWRAPHLDPFAKLKWGWVRPKILFRSGRYALPDVETRRAVWLLLDPRRGPDEYFIVENRWPGSSYDELLQDRGLAVWHVMENPAVYGSVAPPPNVTPAAWSQIGPGEWGRRAIRLIRPILTPPLNDRNALWDGSEPATGYDLLSSDPNLNHAQLRWADGTPSGFALRAISPSGPEMTVTVTVP
jgi:M6 family metalloprotease-like protein